MRVREPDRPSGCGWPGAAGRRGTPDPGRPHPAAIGGFHSRATKGARGLQEGAGCSMLEAVSRRLRFECRGAGTLPCPIPRGAISGEAVRVRETAVVALETLPA
jgi:hypothetical protein